MFVNTQKRRCEVPIRINFKGICDHIAPHEEKTVEQMFNEMIRHIDLTDNFDWHGMEIALNTVNATHNDQIAFAVAWAVCCHYHDVKEAINARRQD